MSELTPERLAEVMLLASLDIGLDRKGTADLLAHIDHLTAENARLREGVEELAETGEADGRGNSRDLARHLRTLLNPTEGETDHE